MATTRQIAHNTAVQMIGKVVSTSLGLLALGMLTRYLGPTQFGWYVTVIAYLQFIGILIDFGLIPVSAQMLSQVAEDADKEKLLHNLLGFRFVTAVVPLALAPLAALFFPYTALIKIAIVISTLSFLGVAMNQIFTGYYQTKLRMEIPAFAELAGRVVLVVGTLLAVKLHWSFLAVMTVIMLATVSYTVVLWIAGAQMTRISFAFDWTVWKKIVKNVWPVALSIVCNVVYLKGDVVLLSLYRSAEEVGQYGAAYRVLDIITQMAMMIMGILLPLLAFAWSRNNREEFHKHYDQAFDILMLFAIPMMVGTILLGNPIMTFVAGQNFGNAGTFLSILAIAVFGVYLGAVFGHTALAINRQKATIWIYLSDAILTFTGYLILIPKFGAIAAAWLSVFSELYAGFGLYLVVRHYTGISPRLRRLGKIILASTAMGLSIFFLSSHSIFLLIPMGIAVYGLVLFALGGISWKTLKEITALRPVAETETIL